ncbi:MAG: AraC family transcriptional regulator [Bacteroidota bacterium]
MQNFFEYPTHSAEDQKWGMVIHTVGFSRTLPDTPYPPMIHPKEYQFDSFRARKLDEYQLIYITSGRGIFELEGKVRFEVNPGTIFLVFPKVAHRYKPRKETGWTEYYVGVNGNIVDRLLEHGFLSVEQPVHEVGIHEHLVRHYHEIFQLAKAQKVAWQQAASAAVYHLIGDLLYLIKNNTVDSATEVLIRRVKTQIAERMAQKIDWNELGKLNGVSYSKMRKTFREYVGMSLGQYQQQLRLNQAKVLLTQSEAPIKEIAFSLGYQNEYYFNTAFKKKNGLAPGTYRKMSQAF